MDMNREVDLAVAFKMGEILSYIENQRKFLYVAILQGDTSQKTMHRFEYIKEIQKQIQKEVQMYLPCDSLSEEDFKKRRDTAIEKIQERLKLHGSADGRQLTRFFVRIIEDLLRG